MGTLVGVKACVATFSGLSAASIIAKSAPRSRHLCIKSSPRPSNFCPRHHTPCLLNSTLLYYDISMVQHLSIAMSRQAMLSPLNSSPEQYCKLGWLNNSVKRSYITTRTCRDLGTLWQAVLYCVNNVNFACVVWIGACCCSQGQTRCRFNFAMFCDTCIVSYLNNCKVCSALLWTTFQLLSATIILAAMHKLFPKVET